MVMRSSVFWNIMLHSLSKVNQYFGGTCYIHLQLCLLPVHDGFLIQLLFDHEDEGDMISEMIVTWNYITEDRTLHERN